MAGTKSVDLGSLGRVCSRGSMYLSVADSDDDPDFLRQLDWAFSGSQEDGAAESPGAEMPLILSVDDDEVNHMVINQHLGKMYRIVEAMDGHEALDYLRSDQERPTCVLLDLMMPGITGLEVVHTIREELKLSHAVLPVIILSARSPLEETSQSAFDHGATDFLQKPFSGKQLLSRLNVFPHVRRDCLALHRKMTKMPTWDPNQACDTGAAPMLDTEGKDEELAQAREEIARLQEQLDRQDESEDRLRKELASAQEEAARLRADAESSAPRREELEGLRSELAAASEEAARLGRDLDAARQAQAEASSPESPDAGHELDSLRSQLAAANQETARQCTELARLQRELEAAKRAAASPDSQEPSRELARLRSELASAKEEALRAAGSPRARSEAGASVCRTVSAASNRELRWLQTERKMFLKQLDDLINEVLRDRTEAHRERVRANSLAREVVHLKEQLADATQLLDEEKFSGA